MSDCGAIMKIILYFLSAFILISAIVFYFRNQVNVESYIGDGIIEKTGKVLLDNGYIIKFKKFQVQENANIKQNIVKLPKFHKKGMVIFAIGAHEMNNSAIDSIRISLMAQKQNGEILFYIKEKQLSSFSKCVDCYGIEGVSYYYFDSKKLTSVKIEDVKNTSFIINITVDSVPVVLDDNNIQGQIVFMSGGFI